MADVIPAYDPANTVAFSAGGWNGDFASVTNGTSLYTEVNGRLQDANFGAGEQVFSRHIRPYEGFRSEFSGATETVDFHEHLFGTEYRVTDWLPVPGASKRLYVPWHATLIVFRASIFCTNFRIRKNTAPFSTTAPDMYIGIFCDGVLATGSIRQLPVTYYPTYDPPTFVSNYGLHLWGHENVLSQHFDFIEIKNAGADTLPGDHDVDIRVMVLQNTGVEKLYPLYNETVVSLTDHSVTHRIRGGIRSASLIALY